MKRLTPMDWLLLGLLALLVASFTGCATIERHKDAVIAVGATVAITSVALTLDGGGHRNRVRLPYEPPVPKMLP